MTPVVVTVWILIVSAYQNDYPIDYIASAESCEKLASVYRAQGYRAVCAPVKKIIVGNK